MSLTIWDDLECYYRRYGTDTCCCLTLSRYSDRMCFYEDEVPLPSTTRRMLEQAYHDAKLIGLHPNLYQCRVVCANDLFFPEMEPNQVLVSYLLDDKKTLLSRDRHSLSKDVYHQRAIHIYLFVSDA
jgi:hypothetical protein